MLNFSWAVSFIPFKMACRKPQVPRGLPQSFRDHSRSFRECFLLKIASASFRSTIVLIYLAISLPRTQRELPQWPIIPTFERVQWYFKFPKIPTFDMWPIPWIRTLPLPRSFRGSSAELPQISYNETDVSFNMQFLYFLEGQLLIATIFKYKNEMNEISKEWMIWRKRLHSICFRELPQKKKHKKPSAGFRDCSPVPFSKFYDTILHIITSKINDAAQLCIS